MKKNNKNPIIKFCDELTQSGNELAITWEGGGDSGFCELKLNDESIDEPKEIVDQILNLAYDTLGYSSFDGNFSTSGKALYDTEFKCFVGTDYYEYSESDIHNCNIQIRIPESLWFESIRIQYEADSDGIMYEANFEFLIDNGPRALVHENLEAKIKEQLEILLQKEIDGIPHLNNIWEEFTVARDEFENDGDDLVYHIEEIGYSYYKQDPTEICISLNN